MHAKNLLKASSRSLLLAGALVMPGLLFAGNIRQYQFSKTEDAPFKALADGEEIEYDGTWPAQSMLFPAGVIEVNAATHSGFPIGFDFKFGGQVFDQFAVSTTGYILLGYDEVVFNGYGTAFSSNSQTLYPVGNFYLGMTTNMYGVVGEPALRGKIFYKTEGEPGNQVCTVEFNNLRVDENQGKNFQNCGRYSLQIRLYEKDGHVEYAFKEEDTIYTASFLGFYCGMHGWDESDTMLITATGLDNKATVSPKRSGNMLEPDTYIKWDKNDPDNGWNPCFVFTPAPDTPAPTAAPGAITIRQVENDVIISGTKAQGADATMVLISNQPITDLPQDGTTYPVRREDGQFSTMIGSSRVAFYDDLDSYEFTLPDITPGETVYVKALSVNGYPRYNTANTANASFTAAQEAPSWARADLLDGGDGKTVEISWNAKYPVIVAVTDERPRSLKEYAGEFGIPAYNAQTGDEIDGGGKVIYTGEGNSMTYKLETPNRPTYFRIWTVSGTRVSATGADAAALPEATMPYAPDLGNWPLNCTLMGWGFDDENYCFLPAIREYDKAQVIRGFSPENDVNRLTTPLLPAAKGAKLSFSWSAETQRPPEEGDGGVLLPKSREAGYFGEEAGVEPEEGYGIYISLDNPDGTKKELAYISKYDGKMVEFSADNYYDDSSELIPFEVELGDIAKGSAVTIEFAAVKSTRVFIKDFRIDCEMAELPADPASLEGEYSDENETISVKAVKGADAAGTIILVSEGAFDGKLTDGKAYAAGDTEGNGTVVYYGTDSDIEATTAKVEAGKSYTLTAVSYNADGNFNPTTVTTVVETSGVNAIVTDLTDIANARIFNVAGVRLHVKSLNELPAGIYIINGHKLIIR